MGAGAERVLEQPDSRGDSGESDGEVGTRDVTDKGAPAGPHPESDRRRPRPAVQDQFSSDRQARQDLR